MRRLFGNGWQKYEVLFVLLPFLLGATESDEVRAIKEEATGALVEILKLWHQEDYGAIYDRGTTTTKRLFGRQEFISRMKGLGCRTTCCHTTFEVEAVDYRSPTLVVVKGKVGFEFSGRVPPRFLCAPAVRSFPMNKEPDGWRIDLTLILPFF